MAEIQRSGARGTKNRALGNRDLWPLVKSLIGNANRRPKILTLRPIMTEKMGQEKSQELMAKALSLDSKAK